MNTKKLVAVLCVLVASACGSPSSSSNPDGGSSSGTDAGTNPGPDAGAPVSLTGVVETNSSGSQSPTPLAGATVEIAGATPANTTTTDNAGAYTLHVPQGIAFVRASAPTVYPMQMGLVVPPAGATLDLKPVTTSDVNQAMAALGNLTLDTSKGVVIVHFTTSDTAGGYGATLSAAHGNPFAFQNGTPTYSSTTFAGSNDHSVVFPNVTAGTTTVTLSVPNGHTCSMTQEITNYRVDPGVFTQVEADCN